MSGPRRRAKMKQNSRRKRMRRRAVKVVALFGAILAAGCSGTSVSVTNCPSCVVLPDAGVSGFSAVGEWRTDDVCAAYCDPNYPICQWLSTTSVKCQRGCA